jgi:hypothetical protein
MTNYLANPLGFMTLNIGENSKLKKTTKFLRKKLGTKKARVLAFNLPAGLSETGMKVCIGAGACYEVCFARQARYVMESVKRPRENNLAALLEAYKNGGVDAVTALLTARIEVTAATHVRIHDSGDFFSNWYRDAWLATASNLPGVVFYAYTKSVPLFVGKELPSNFVLTYSHGGIWDHMIPEEAGQARIFGTMEELELAGYEDGNSEEEADSLAIFGVKRIGLVYHGVKKLTGAARVALGLPAPANWVEELEARIESGMMNPIHG